GRLADLTEGSKQTTYLYGADGNLLIRRAAGDADSVLYLGNTEVRLTVKGTTKTLTGTRYYTLGGRTVAVRTATAGTTGTKLSFLATDPHGTAGITLDATTWAINKRYTTPFGADRGTPLFGPWPDDKGFLGKPEDTTTGLTHIGARAYDPTTAQFLSVDPILDTTDPQSLNGYTYADNNPTTHSDPTGLYCDGCSAINPGTVWTSENGPGCTSEACYDTDGDKLYDTGGTASSKSSGGSSSTGGDSDWRTGPSTKARPPADPRPAPAALGPHHPALPGRHPPQPPPPCGDRPDLRVMAPTPPDPRHGQSLPTPRRPAPGPPPPLGPPPADPTHHRSSRSPAVVQECHRV
ncbi:RHS repeat-associated core domain-containing protein, partial [Streptomyces sp. NPDC102462]|uniref:RHS repeat-associated core domain-containing protein n=1 Tax=Streptomyces sp. NPDC102462 TaxID=3366178 RepID=UPI0038304EE8